MDLWIYEFYSAFLKNQRKRVVYIRQEVEEVTKLFFKKEKFDQKK
jgi:hypothetical protein